MSDYTGHTPKPWIADGLNVKDANGDTVLTASDPNYPLRSTKTAEANAQLGAAAPELLDERNRLWDVLKDMHPEIEYRTLYELREGRDLTRKEAARFGVLDRAIKALK